MTFLATLAILALGWAVWTGKLQAQALLPVLLGLSGVFLAARGSLLIGVPVIVIAAIWYRGLAGAVGGRRLHLGHGQQQV